MMRRILIAVLFLAQALVIVALLACLSLVLVKAAHAQIALVAHTSAGPSSPNTGATTTTGINTTGANAIAVCLADYGGVAPHDNLGNIYQRLTYRSSGGDINVSLWVVFNPLTSSNHTFSGTGSDGATIAVAAFSGVASAPDALNTGFASATPVNAGALNPTKPNEMALTCAGSSFGGALSVASPLTLPNTGLVSGSTSAWTVGMGYQIQGSTASSVNPQWSGSSSGGPYVAIGATFFSTLNPGPLAVTTSSLPEGFVTQAYSQQLVSSGGISPKTWAMTSGSLPAGMNLSAGGLLFGTPTASGTFHPVFTVTDAQSNTASSSALTLIVASSPLNLSASGVPLTGKQLTAYAGGSLTASGGTPPYTYAYDTTANYDSLVEGITLNPSTGALSGSRIQGQGGYAVNFILTDSAGAQTTLGVTFEIDGDNSALAGAFPQDSAYHLRVDTLPADTSILGTTYSAYANSMLRPLFGREPDGGGIPVTTVPCTQPMVSVVSQNGGNTFVNSQGPIPIDTSMERTRNHIGDGGDSHVLVFRQACTGMQPSVWELYQVYPNPDGSWFSADESYDAQFSPPPANPPNSLSYAIPNPDATVDAAGLSVTGYLLTADEIIGNCTAANPCGAVTHAIRFTLQHTLNYHVWPATAQAGQGRNSCSGGYTDPSGNYLLSQASPPTTCQSSSTPGNVEAPMGEIYRLKASVAEPSACSSNPWMHIIFVGLQRYGIINADNGGTGYLIGTNDARFPAYSITSACLNALKLGQMEGVNVSSKIVSAGSIQTVGGLPVRLPVIQGGKAQGGVIRP